MQKGTDMNWIKDSKHLDKVQEQHGDFLILVFYAGFSSVAKQALKEIEKFCREYQDVAVYLVDVEKVKGIHKQFGVKDVPTVIAIEKGKVTRLTEGVESARFYARLFAGAKGFRPRKRDKRQPLRVVVYSGPGCPACGSAKTYLRKRGISFREVNIANDKKAAERLVQRSGQMAVPQIDINGQLVVGFDQSKLDRLL